MKRSVIFFAAFFVLTNVCAQEEESFSFTSDSTIIEVNKALADSAYAAGDYTTATNMYETLLQNGESSVLYYNLGNAYFKSDEIALAILNYERALLLDPSNSDIRFNLELATSKTVDRISEVTEIFFVRWFRNFANLMSLDTWSKIAVATFILFVLTLALFIFGKKTGVKKTFFTLSVLFLLAAILSLAVAASQKERLTVREDAIVMPPSVVVRSTPGTSGTELFVLHEGRKVHIKDDSMNEWKEIELEDGNVGWIDAKAIERI